MAEHAGAQAAPPLRQPSETHPIDRDNRHQFPALVAVTETKNDALEGDSPQQRASEYGKLPLQVATKDHFLAETSGYGQRYPKDQFEWRLRQHSAQRLRRSYLEHRSKHL